MFFFPNNGWLAHVDSQLEVRMIRDMCPAQDSIQLLIS